MQGKVHRCLGGVEQALESIHLQWWRLHQVLARLPDLSPAAYRSLYLWPRLPLTGPMRSVLVFAPVGLGFRFGAFPAPMCLAVSAQVFLLWWKTSFLGNARDPFAKAIAVLRLYLTPLSALRSGVEQSLAFNC